MTSSLSLFQNNPYYYLNKSRKDQSLPKSLFPTNSEISVLRKPSSSNISTTARFSNPSVNASLIENPVIWGCRLYVYYALLKAGLVGSQTTGSLISADSQGGGISDLGFSKWIEGLQGRSGL